HPTEATRVHCTRCGRPICTACMIPAPVGHQCPECVEAAKREFRQSPAGRAQSRLRPPSGLSATRAILFILVAAYFVEIYVGGPNSFLTGPNNFDLYNLGAMVPGAVAAGQYWRLLSATLLHAGLLHIGLNAWALWIFGGLVERTFGRGKFLAIYVVSAFLGSVTSYVFGPTCSVAVGASGAIVGLFGAFIAYNLKRRHVASAMGNLRWAATIIIVNAVIGLGFPGVDWRAHVGGLLAGAAVGAGFDVSGPSSSRSAIGIATTAGVVLVGILLVMWRTNTILHVGGPCTAGF
ncbi:MAG: rhomboid family intramembrane serine protease, partial [Actinomycetota bacterium]